MGPTADITGLLVAVSNGERAARTRLIEALYDELRRLARGYLRRERPDHSLPPTALGHDAFLKLVDQRRVRWHNRAQFFAVAAHQMRRILVDHAERIGRSSAARAPGCRCWTSPRTRRARSISLRSTRRSRSWRRAILARANWGAAFFRRAHRRGDGGGPWRRAHHGEARLGVGESVAVPRGPRAAGMNPRSNWESLRALFEAALERPPAERAAFLAATLTPTKRPAARSNHSWRRMNGPMIS